MDKEISQKSFKQIKLMAKILDKAAKIDPEGYELDNLPGGLEEKAEDMLPYQEDLGEYMSDNSDLACAGNLNIYNDGAETLVYTNNADIADPNDEPFDYTSLRDRLHKLIKLGRDGIFKLNERNQKLAQKIYKIQDEMNVIG